MTFDPLQTLEVIEAMENYLSRNRPPEEIRKKLDLGYKIEGQSVFIFEIRPQWNDPNIIHEHPFAKATFVKTINKWKVFWIRANMKWYTYTPKPTVKSVAEFAKLVEEDEHHCFGG
jgi:hypothetical protein